MDPLVYNMSHEDPGSVSYSEIGGLSEQIRELREVRHGARFKDMVKFVRGFNWSRLDSRYTTQIPSQSNTSKLGVDTASQIYSRHTVRTV